MIRNSMGIQRWWRGSVIIAMAAAAWVVSGACAGTNASANSKPTDVPAQVIAHLPLNAPAGNQMVLQKQGDKRYLYIQQASKKGYIVVEVTKPQFPSFVKSQPSSNDATAGRLDVMSNNLAVAEVPDAASKAAIRSTPSTSTVRILDLSDPENPTTLQTFKNVTSILADGGRGIIYLTNDEGLWVLKQNRQLLAPARTKKPCDSYSAIAAMPPDCQ